MTSLCFALFRDYVVIRGVQELPRRLAGLVQILAIRGKTVRGICNTTQASSLLNHDVDVAHDYL